MNFDEIDWVAAWNETVRNAPAMKHRGEKDPIKFWNDRAFQFNADTKREGSEDVGAILQIAEVTKQTTILDVGAGTGRFSIPLAKLALYVTAVDPSPEMLKYLQKNAVEAGVESKIRMINRKWEDSDFKKDLQPHEIVIAPYVMGHLDVERALPLLIATSLKWVFIFTWVVRHTKKYRQLWQTIHGEAYSMPPEHLLLLNMLYKEGIHANLKISPRSWWEYYSGEQDAFASFKKRITPLDDTFDELIWQYVRENRVPDPIGVKFPAEGRSAMVWWEKEECMTP